MPSGWGDKERATVQLFLRERCVKPETLLTFLISIRAIDPKRPEAQQYQRVRETVSKIGHKLFELGYGLKSVPPSKSYVLYNLKDDKLGSSSEFTPAELNYFKRVLRALYYETEEICAREERLLETCRDHGSALTRRDIVELLGRLVARKWLTLSNDGYYSLGERGAAELAEYLSEELPEHEFWNCPFCKKQVLTRCVNCKGCGKSPHIQCYEKRLADGVPLCCDNFSRNPRTELLSCRSLRASSPPGTPHRQSQPTLELTSSDPNYVLPKSEDVGPTALETATATVASVPMVEVPPTRRKRKRPSHSHASGEDR